MKKKYQSPIIFSIKVQTSRVISSSIIISGDADIQYGGVDNDGSIVPETKLNRNVWDDEW